MGHLTEDAGFLLNIDDAWHSNNIALVAVTELWPTMKHSATLRMALTELSW